MTSELLIQSVTTLTSVLQITNNRLYELEKLVSGLQKENEELKHNFRAREYGITTTSVICYITVDPDGNCYLYPTEDEALDHIQEKISNFEGVCDEEGELREEFLEELAKSGNVTINEKTYRLNRDIIYPHEHSPSGCESQLLKRFRESHRASERRQKIDEIKNSIRECIEPT